MPKFQTFSAEQQSIIDKTQAQFRAMYQADPHHYDNAEGEAKMEQIAREAAHKVIALMPDGLKFRATDIEQAIPYGAQAIRRHLSRLAQSVDDHRQLYQDGAWYMWESGDE